LTAGTSGSTASGTWFEKKKRCSLSKFQIPNSKNEFQKWETKKEITYHRVFRVWR